ncbi:uncharacterized protein LOC105208015 [Solenopsis invicta]|uniref:uncharacterized protein LOC105208015 n=1 Tax=Solenopsis invicta TaxID=13686 RepID=UPI00193D98B3|nr:uncharacterized protein LOC105208015 [Solenopsis invicta]
MSAARELVRSLPLTKNLDESRTLVLAKMREKKELGGNAKYLRRDQEPSTTLFSVMSGAADQSVMLADGKQVFHLLQCVARAALAKETSAHLNGLLNTTNESINAFKSLKLPVEHWDMVFIQCIESKLAPATRMDWAKQVETLQDGFFPKFELFKKFLEDRIQTLDRVEAVIQASADSKGKFSNGQQGSSGKQPKGKSTAVHTTVSSSSKSNSSKFSDPGSCAHCQGPHFISRCKGFAALSRGKRKHLAVNKDLCTNCLSNRQSNHKVDECKSQGRCLVCAGLHHTRLHQDGQHLGFITQHLSESSRKTTTHVTSSSPQILCEQLLATAVVTLQSETGVSLTARVLLDSCAEQCIVLEYVVQALNLKRKPAHVIVNSTGGTPNTVAQSRVGLILKSQRDANFLLKFSALVLKKISNLVPKRRVKPQERWSHLDGLHLADPHYGAPSRLHPQLGSLWRRYATRNAAVNPLEAPIAHETGWVLMGSAKPNNSLSERTSVHHVSVDYELTKAVARFWETEEVPRVHQPSYQDCWDQFKRTIFRNREGRYVVRLPFSKTPQFSGIDTKARVCMMRLERRFAKQPDVASAYSAFMREYIDLGHMEVVPESEVATNQAYYLPHHPVFKRDCDKIRVVFNGSQKGAIGVSLNSRLHAGPKLIWTGSASSGGSPETPLLSYRLLTVTYGTASAPFHAKACLLDFAEAEAHRFPLGSKLLRKNCCVDDFLAGGDTPEKAAAAKTELVGILSSSGMAVDMGCQSRRPSRYS